MFRLTAGKMPKSNGYGIGTYKSATVTEPFWKQKGWNEVNPASEKPKFGRGVFPKEMNEGKEQTYKSEDR